MKVNFCPYCMNPVADGEPCPVCGLTKGSYTPAPHHLPPGTVLQERYLIGRVLGEGGFGITYIGCDLQLEVKVAIKEYFPVSKVSRDAKNTLTVACYTGAIGENYEDDLERFLREARTMAKLAKQPVIVSIHDFFRANGTAYIVMEYIDGTTFKDLVKQRGGKIPAGELLPLLEPLFFALQTVHEAGLIHRDLSPDNLMLEDGNVRLLDFGCAREVGGDKTLTVSLKHSYAPVEQYQGKGQGPWTDIYALAATIYYCLTGTKPPQAMDRLLEDELIAPRKLGSDLTDAQEAALLKAMSIRPRQRYQSVKAFYAALYEDSGRRTAAAAAVSAGAAAAALAEGILSAQNTSEEEPQETEAKTNADTTSSGQPEAEINADTTSFGQPEAGTTFVENKTSLADTGTVLEEKSPAADPKETAPEEETAEAEQPPAEEKKSTGFAGWIKNNPLIAGILAAIIILIIIIALVFVRNTRSDTDTPTDDVTDETVDTAETAETEKAYTIENGVAYVTDDEEETLLEALADDDVESVVVSGDGYIYTTETLELHKSLTLESGIYASSPVIVGEDGSITVDSQEGLCICGLLRTMDGGTVTVTSDGCMGDESAVLWLENWEDLTVEDGGTFQVGMGRYYGEEITEGSSTWYYNVIDEDALFADAVSVTTEEELQEAAEDGSAVIITEDITLTESFYQSVPVQIAEGVTVIALAEDQDLDEDGNIVRIDGDNREAPFSWTVDAQTVLINHGTIKGDIYTEGDEEDNELSAWVINDGTMDVSGEIGGMLINLEEGTCNFMHGTLNQGGVVNLGTFTHTPRLYDNMQMQSYFFNSGTLLIEGTADIGSYADLASGEMRNSASGIIEIGAYASFTNLTGIESQGQIILTTDTSSFWNQGTLDMANQYVGTLEVTAGSFENTGLVRYTEDGYPYASEDANALCAYAEVWVYSASELQEALQDEGVSEITIDADITWEDGDLLISEKDVILYGSLTVTGGNLTVENGAFWCTGEINLDGGTFTAQGLGVVYASSLNGCSELNIQASSNVILENGELYDMAINLNVEDGENGDAALTTKYDLSLYNCTMTLATENSYIYCWVFDYDEASTVSTVGDLEEQIISYD